MSPGILGLLVVCGCGIIIAQRLFRLSHPLEFLPVGLTTGWLWSAMSANLCLRAGLDVDQSMVGSVVVSVGLAALLLAFTSPPEPEKKPLSPFTWCYFLLMTGLVYFTAVSILFLNPDDDFWLHAPMQAQLLKGNFPIRNPVFPELSYGGHYARDLSMVMLSWWSGLNLYASQAPVTAFLQVNAFWLIFAAGLRFGRSQITAVLSSLFLFMGVNAAGRGGWLDTVSNNNPLAQVHTALLMFLFLRILFEEVEWKQVIGTGVLFAGLAWTYETNFVALSLSLLAFACIVAAKRELTKKQLKITGVIVAVSLSFLLLQGGIFGELVEKLASSETETVTDATTQAQNLEVSVKFPKEQMFQIKLSRAGDEISMAYYTFPIFKQFDLTPQEPGYVSVFSPVVWRIHWLSLYFSPLVFFLLWRYNNKLGFLFWGFGFASYFIPAVIDFGLWEVEVFRWEYAASCGFAGALGVALGEWLHNLKGKPVEFDHGHLRLNKRLIPWLVVGLTCWLNCFPTWVQVENRTSQLPSLKRGFVIPDTETWLDFHPVLGLEEADIKAGLRLSPLVKPGEHFLMTRRDLSPSDTLPESAFVGLTGTQTIGHAFPLQCERVGTMPFRKSAHALAYWATGDAELLRNRELKWLYVKENGAQAEISESESLKEIIREPALSGDRVVYEVSQEAFPPFQPSQEPHPTVKFVQLTNLEGLRNEEYRELKVATEGLRSLGRTNQILTYRFYQDSEELPYEEGLSQSITPGLEEELTIHFVSPHNPGLYEVRFYLGEGSEQHLVGQFPLETVQLRAFQQLEAKWPEEISSLQGGLVQPVEVELFNPSEVALDIQGIAGLTAQDPSGPFPRDFQELNLQLEPGQRKVLTFMVAPPRRAGEFPFELVLNPQDGLKSFALPPREVGY